MKVFYVDEAGCPGALPRPDSDIQPVFVIAGVVFDAEAVPALTHDFLALKRRFFPGSFTSQHKLDDILVEVKGADLRRNAIRGNRNTRRAARGFLDRVFDLVEGYDVLPRHWTGIGNHGFVRASRAC